MEVLVNNKIVIVDGEYIPSLNNGRGWGVRKDNAVVVWFGKGKSKLLHRVIMDAPKGMTVDHINGDRLDNRRENLRLCTHAQNACNKKPEKIGNKRKETHPYKGIIKHTNNYLKKKWFAQIGHLGNTYHSKRFLTEEEAARAYDELAKKHHGEFARLNFPNKKVDL